MWVRCSLGPHQSSSYSLERSKGDKTRAISQEGPFQTQPLTVLFPAHKFQSRCRPWPQRAPDSFPSKVLSPTRSRTVFRVGAWLTRETNTRILSYSSSMAPGSIREPTWVPEPVLQQAESLGLLSRGQREGRKKVCAAASRRHGTTMPLFLFYVWSSIL